MQVVRIEPTKTYPMPYRASEGRYKTFRDAAIAAGNTAEALQALGAPMDLSEAEIRHKEAKLLAAMRSGDARALTDYPVALGAAEFIRAYGTGLAWDAARIRQSVTAKLLELANCGTPNVELKALELLGKHSDVGLFTERTEVSLNYKSPEEMEAAIRDRVKRLLNADVIDMSPRSINIEKELGSYPPRPRPEYKDKKPKA